MIEPSVKDCWPDGERAACLSCGKTFKFSNTLKKREGTLSPDCPLCGNGPIMLTPYVPLQVTDNGPEEKKP